MNEMKNHLMTFLDVANYFSLPDYLVLSCIFLMILLFFLLSVALRFNAIVATLTFLISGILLFSAPFLYQMIMESYLKQIDLTLFHNERLHYDGAYFVEGQFTNVGLLDFRGCVLSVNFIPAGLKKHKRIKYQIKPQYLHIENYKIPLKKLESMEFKLIIPSPKENMDFIMETKGACY
ncbi:DUF2393 family protein [Helicobacter sp. MIT 05-5294]|uniref:DUF2393 family protein n=1 Tax=Helicobacter sp. MIT 05-5294 TaxID=1548150 RepID=UPI0010FF09B3|nr:DUF2393 family protein [Helicobacter sp. MIT 05-5294]TLD86981.1 DUF2393 domain-containing protein [Helicobacter sp. MIT 05-5294]